MYIYSRIQYVSNFVSVNATNFSIILYSCIVKLILKIYVISTHLPKKKALKSFLENQGLFRIFIHQYG